MKKIYYVVLTTFMLLFMQQTKAQDLSFGTADIATYADAAAASVLKSGNNITISQIGSQGVSTGAAAGTYILLNNTNSALNLNNTGRDAITIAVSGNTIHHIVVNMASNSTTAEAGPYVGYHSSVSAMGSTTATTSSCNLTTTSGFKTPNDYTFTPAAGTNFVIMVRGAACVGTAANTQSARIHRIDVYLNCTAPTIGTSPSTIGETICQNATATALSIAASGGSGTITYQWFSNSSASTSGAVAVSGATSSTYTPSTTTAGTKYYYCVATCGSTCSTTSGFSGSITVNATPTPTFTASPSSSTAANTNVTYTTQSSQSSYVWSVPGTSGVDYNIVSGGISSTDNTVTLAWLTSGNKTVTVGYTTGSCASTTPASNLTNVTSAFFYNKAGQDVTQTSNWGTIPDGTGTAPSNFIDDGQTFNITNTGATLSGDWTVSGTSSKVVVGNGASAVTFNASTVVNATIDVNNNGTLLLSNAVIPTFGILATGSTVEYGGSSITQAITAATYSNLTLSGSGSRTFSGNVALNGTFNPGTGFSATAGTIDFTGTSSSQAIPAFAYNNLSVSGADGKSTSGNSTVSSVLTMNNSFTLGTSQTILLDSLGSMASTSGKTLTVNGTFDRRFPYNSNTFSVGSGAMQIASGGTFKASGRSAGNNATPNQLTLTNVNFASGTSGGTLHVTAGAAPRIPTTVAGNVIWAINSDTFAIHNIVSSAVPTMNTIGGHLTIANTGAAIASLAGGSSSRALTVSGNLYMTSGRFDVATYSTTAGGATATGANLLTINGDIIVNSSSDTLYTTSSPTSSSNDTIFIKGNLIHTAGVIGKARTNRYVNSSFVATPVVASNGVISFNGTSAQTISTIGMDSSVVLSINNAAGVTMSTNVTIDGSVTMTNGVLKTNGNTLTVAGASATPFTGTSFGSASSSFVGICDASGTTSSIGGVTIANIGSGGRTGAILFPIGATPSSYNPFTINNASSAVAFTAQVSNTAIAGVTSVQRTWNIVPASGSPSSVIAMQWSATDEGASFTRTSSSVAHSTGSSIDVQSGGANAAGSNPYTLSSNVTSFTGYGDFGVTNGVVVLATEPAVQASNVVITPASTSMNISWTKGSDATYSLVVVKLGSAVNAGPTDATGYTSSSSFTAGTQIGTGNFVVYSSTGNSLNVTGLTANTRYYVAVYSFNGSGGQENYLTSSPATADTTTDLTTYYYVGGAGGITSASAWNTANRWATSVGGTPLTAFAASNTDQFIFDGSNLGTTAVPYTGAVSIAAVNPTNVIGKIVVRNNATVTIASTNSATSITLGNSGFAPNTTVLRVDSASTLSFNGSTYTGINLQTNSSASISGTLNLGNSSNVSLFPNSTGSSITFNNGAVCESNQSSSATAPFGTFGSGLVTFANGSTFKHTKGADAFGGAGFNVSTFAASSLYWFNNTSAASSFTLDGRTYGNVKVSTSATPVAGPNGFTMYNLELAGATTKLSTAFTGTNNHIKGNITIPAGDTLRFSPGTVNASTLNFSGTTAQTISTNITSGYWQVISTGLQSFVLSNTAGLSISGNFNMGQAAGTAFTINSGCNLHLASDTLTVGGTSTTGALVVNGTITRASGVIKTAATSSTAIVTLAGMSSIPAGLFVSNTVRNLTINRSAGISTNGTLTVSNALALTSGVVTTGSDTLIVSAAGSLTRTSGWVNGNLRKNIPTGTSVTSTFDIGDASNYLPVVMNFASVTNAGDLILKINAPASSEPNYATATISNSNYINRYWSIGKVGSLAFTTYNVTFNYLNADKVGTATESTVIAARYLTNWSKTTPSAGTNANTVNSLVSFGDFILADCVTYTPTISISSTTTAVCAGSSVIFTASAVNAGPTPTYQWKKNGTTNIGTNSATLTLLDNQVTTGDAITCVLTPNNLCQTSNSVTSNSISLFVGSFTPSVSIATATTSICSGSNTTFTATPINGGSSPSFQWKKNGVDAGSGSAITFLSNTLSNGDVITCVLTANNTCQTTPTAASNAIQMTVNISPTVAQITNGISAITTATMCTLGTTIRYYNATPYGTWSSSDPTIVSLTAGNQAGIVTANTNGTATISYSLAASNGCISTSSLLITVAQQTAPTAISGNNSICVNATTSLSSTAPVGTTGVWSSSNNRGIINVSGVYTGANAGSGEARYTVTNTTTGCKAFSAYTITVNATPVVPTISYAPGTVNPQIGATSGGYCVGKVFTVVGTPNVPAGVWSSTGIASVTSGGVVTINAVGAGTIKYTYTSAAGCVNSRTIVGNGYSCAARGVVISNEILVNNNDFTMYPNPAKGFINLNVEALVGAGSIIVTDLYGKSVKMQNLSMGSNTVDISNLSKGFYLVSVITSEGKTTKKLIVE